MLVEHYTDGKLTLKETVKGTLGILEVSGRYSLTLGNAGGLMRIYEYVSRFLPVSNEEESREFAFLRKCLPS